MNQNRVKNKYVEIYKPDLDRLLKNYRFLVVYSIGCTLIFGVQLVLFVLKML